jgi:hypothetical protein
MQPRLLLSLLISLGMIQPALAKAKDTQSISGNSGIAVNAKGNVNLTVIQKFADYQALQQEVDKAKQRYARHPDDVSLSEELQQVEKNLVNFTRDLLKLAEDIQKISFNSKRDKAAKRLFELGDYAAARNALNSKEMAQEQQALLDEQQRLQQHQAENAAKLNDSAEEFILKAKLTALYYSLGEQRIPQTRQFFESALKSGRTPERLFAYAFFLQENNQFADAERYYREALSTYRTLAKDNPSVYLPKLANVLQGLGEAYLNWQQPKQAVPYFQEAAEILAPFAKQAPEVFGEKQEYIEQLLQQARAAK